MFEARITAHPSFVVGPVRRGTFGSFVEHLGRCVYSGIYEPGHPTADDQGFRTDVLELVKELGVSTVRYPGGNFVSGYRWEDGVGPKEQRPTRYDLAWHSTETNEFGLNEFMAWTKASGTEAMMAVNLGTRGIEAALELLEYANVENGTARSELRRSHGVDEPHNIMFWCLGNEMDGPWQLGHKTAEEYGRLAAETARGMRQMFPDLTLAVCGSSSSNMPTFGEWERVVLTETFDQIDLISAHAYYNEAEDLGSFLASAMDLDHFVSAVTATADAVAAQRKSTKRINISFDEWNVWYHQEENAAVITEGAWPVAPRMEEDRYTIADAVVVGNLLISLLRNTDRVHSASQAQLVNAIAPIMTEPGGPAWKQTIFHPFALTSQHASGEVLRTIVDAPAYENKRFGESPLVDSVVTRDSESGAVSVFIVNRAQDAPTRVVLDVGAFGGLSLVEAISLADEDPHWRASMEDSTSVLPANNISASLESGVLTVILPPISWTMVRLQTA